MHKFRGIDRHLIVAAERPNRLDVVGVVVSNQQVLYGLERYSIILAEFLKGAYSYTYIDHQSVGGSREIVAITAAAASKRYKS
jgi:hypothetical protein